MGEILKINCDECREEWQCSVGCGLLHGWKENVIAAFEEPERTAVSRWMNEQQIPLYDFAYQTASCPHCNKLVSVPVVRGIDTDEVFVGKCPVCGETVQVFSQDEVEQTACPVCGARALHGKEIGHWD